MNNDLEEKLPQDKFDDSNLIYFKGLPEKTIEPILPRLFEWLADFNWPIASKVRDIVVEYPNTAVPLIKEALKGKDEILKYWLINEVIPYFSTEVQLTLVEDIQRISQFPTEGEKEEEIDLDAAELLNQLMKPIL